MIRKTLGEMRSTADDLDACLIGWLAVEGLNSFEMHDLSPFSEEDRDRIATAIAKPSRKRHRRVGASADPGGIVQDLVRMLSQPRRRSVRRHRKTVHHDGERTDGIAPLLAAADGRSILMPRATTWGSAKTSATLLIGPAGTPWASRAERSPSRVILMVFAVSRGTRSARWLDAARHWS